MLPPRLVTASSSGGLYVERKQKFAQFPCVIFHWPGLQPAPLSLVAVYEGRAAGLFSPSPDPLILYDFLCLVLFFLRRARQESRG